MNEHTCPAYWHIGFSTTCYNSFILYVFLPFGSFGFPPLISLSVLPHLVPLLPLSWPHHPPLLLLLLRPLPPQLPVHPPAVISAEIQKCQNQILKFKDKTCPSVAISWWEWSNWWRGRGAEAEGNEEQRPDNFGWWWWMSELEEPERGGVELIKSCNDRGELIIYQQTVSAPIHCVWIIPRTLLRAPNIFHSLLPSPSPPPTNFGCFWCPPLEIMASGSVAGIGTLSGR